MADNSADVRAAVSARRQTRRTQVAKSTARVVRTARDARSELIRVIELVERQSELRLVDGEIHDRVKFTSDERVDRLTAALTWLQQAEQTMRFLRIELERLHEFHQREVYR